MAVAPRETTATEIVEPLRPARARSGAAARDALVVLAGLLLVCGVAAALGGARAVPDATWVECLTALVALIALGAWAADRRSPADVFAVRAWPVAWVGVASIAALAFWALASLAWSSAPDASWEVFNREIAYALFALTAIAVGASAPRAALPWAAAGVALVATLVALWALGGVVSPGLFGHAASEGRLRAPLETFLDLGILCGLAAPVALRVFASGTRAVAVRVLALAGAVVLLVALGLTFSRAGVLVLVAGLLVSVVGGGARLRTLGGALLALAAAAIPLSVGFSADGLGVSASDGRAVGLALLGAVAVAAAGAWFALRSEERSLQHFTTSRANGAAIVLAGLAVAALLAVALAVASSDRGFGGSISHAVDTLTAATPAPAKGDADRLQATDSGGRRVLWDEALGAASDKPVAGWGAGSWPVLHGMYRPADIPGRDARSSVLQILAERGVVGLALLAVALLALLTAVALRIRALPSGPERDICAAALGAGAGLVVAVVVASTWELPAVVLPALLLLGVGSARPGLPAGSPAIADPDPRAGGWRWGALAAGTIVLALVATSALLPAWSHGRTQAALKVAGDPAAGEDALQQAAADARLASKLDPPAAAPQLAAAAVAQRRARLLEARGELLKAVDEQPDNGQAWAALSRLALALADRPGALAAAERALSLDPMNPDLRALARSVQTAQAPPSSSPTATGTPLPGFVVR